jgi:hypothetical protein
MVDSTEFFEVYNTTGEVLQNVPPTLPIVGYAVLGLFLLSYIFIKKHKKLVSEK